MPFFGESMLLNNGSSELQRLVVRDDYSTDDAIIQDLQLTTLKLGSTTVTSITTDGTFAANSDSNLPTEKAIKTYVGSSVANLVTGPASAIDNEITRFNGATGKIVQAYTSTGPTVGDTGVITISNATAATSKSTGCLITTGGVGVGGNLIANNIFIDANNNLSFGDVAARPTFTTAQNNILLGYQAGNALTSGAQCVLIGSNAGVGLQSAGDSILIGHNAGLSMTSGINNVCIGTEANFNATTGQDNVFIGYRAGKGTATSTDVDNSVGIGSNALSKAEADGLIGIGVGAGQNLTTATGSIGIGYQALNTLTTGSFSTAVGYQSAFTNSTTSRTTAVGYQALYNTTSANNTAIGSEAGKSFTVGARNICIGSICANTGWGGGSYNILMGVDIQATATSRANNIAIGDALSCDTDNRITLGTTSHTSFKMPMFTSNPGALVTDSSGVITALTPCYGGYYAHENAVALGISVANQDIGLVVDGAAVVSTASGVTFTPGVKRTITAIVDGTGGKIQVTTSAGHSLNQYDPVFINSTTNYNGYYIVSDYVDTTNFKVVKTYVSDEASGYCQKPDFLVLASSGKFQLSVSMTILGNAANAIMDLHMYYSTTSAITICNECTVKRTFGNATDYGSLSITSLHTAATANQKIMLGCSNTSAVSSPTIHNINVAVRRFES